MMNNDIDNLFERLSKSSFRSKFRLKDKDILYVKEKGMDKIRSHAIDFISKRLAPCNLPNDGKQTPMHGHPVFIAQHATATCCRSCLYKWYHILPDHDLTNNEVNYIVDVIMKWINNQIK